MKNGNNDKGKLLTVRKLSEIYGINPQTTYYYLRNRYFPFFKVNKTILFWEKDFLDFLAKHMIQPETEIEGLVEDEEVSF